MSPRRVAVLCLLLSTAFVSAQSPPNYYLQRRTGDTGPMSTQKVTGAASKIWGTDANGLLGTITLGSGLTLSGGTLTSSGSGGTWGSITGTLSAQTDLQAALDAKAAASHTQAWSTITSTPTTLSGYGITDAQGLSTELTALAGLTTTSFGRGLLELADAAALRSSLVYASGALNIYDTGSTSSSALSYDSGGAGWSLSNGASFRSALGLSYASAGGIVVTTGDTGTVSSAMIASGAVTTAKIADGNVTSGKLEGGLPTPTHYTPSASTVSGHLSGIDTALAEVPPQGQEVNVKSATYGAVGDAIQLRDAVSTSGDNTVTSASASFVSGDVGKIVFAGDPSSHAAVVPWGTITAVNSSTSIEVSVAATASATGLYLVYGTADDTDAFQSAAAAVKAMSPPGTLRIPAGGYIIKGTPFDFGQASAVDAAPAVVGDGSESTILYIAPSFSATSDTLMYLNGNCARGKVSGLSVEGSYIQPLVSLGLCFNPGGGRVLFEDVKITRLHQIIGFQIIGQHCVLDRCYVEICTGYYGWGIYCNASGVSIRDTYAGNNGNWSLYCANGAEVIWERGTLDESGGTAPAVLVAGSSKLTISNCQYVYSVGGSVPAIQLQGTAQLRMINSWAGPYASRPNAYALDVDSGCKAYLMQSVLERNDTPNALIIDSGGTVYDGGNNEVESVTNNGTLTTLSITP